jgi:hypothetical protein
MVMKINKPNTKWSAKPLRLVDANSLRDPGVGGA